MPNALLYSGPDKRLDYRQSRSTMFVLLLAYGLFGLVAVLFAALNAGWLWCMREVNNTLRSEKRDPAKEWYLVVLAPFTIACWMYQIRQNQTTRS